MEKIKELCGNSRAYFKMIKLYNNFDMPIGERNRLIKTDSKEQEKFIEFLLDKLYICETSTKSECVNK